MERNSSRKEKAYKVFVSSTYLDNKDRREIVENAILRAEMIPIGMERFNATTGLAENESLKLVEQADVLVGIIAWRYGWIPKGSKLSVTEFEYNAAKERLMFVIDPSLPVDPQIDPDEKKQEKLRKFKVRIAKDQLAAHFTDQTLGMQVLDALVKWRQEQEYDESERLLRDYLEDVEAQTNRINIQGIFSESGAGRMPVYFPIEEHYTPLKSGSVLQVRDNVSEIGMPERGEYVPLTDLLSRQNHLLIVGDPGGGKTTFLRFIACVLAKDRLDSDQARCLELLGLAPDPEGPIPILLSVARLAEAVTDNNCGGAWRSLTQTLMELFGQPKAHLLEEALDQGQCVVLLDGLDEVADPAQRTRMAEAVNAVIHHWSNNRFVITSRPFGYQAVAGLEGMATAHVCAFEEPEILEFMQRWAEALYPDTQERMRDAYLPELRSAVLNVSHIKRMAQNPVMLTCLCVVHWNERHLPEGKADLLMAVLRWLLNAKESKRKHRNYTNTFVEECFKELALAMCIDPEGKQVNADLAWAAEQLERPFLDERDITGNQLRREGLRMLEAEMVDSGIVCQDSTGRLRFWHLTFQEHYAGRALVELGDGDSGWWEKITRHLHDEQWQEILDHFAGCLARIGRRGLNLLVERILGQAQPENLESTARAVGILGRLLRILEVYDYQPPTRLGWDQARDRVMAIFTSEGAKQVAWRERIAAAEALGQAGDPRFVGRELNPEMRSVSGMKGIQLGKYPVTVLEFKCFVESGAYHEERFWGDHWPMKTENQWESPKDWDNQLKHLNRPVTGVSWYEACAYCQWLSERTNLLYCLPSSEHWEIAATHPEGEYPWGRGDPNEELLNCELNVNAPSPVGVYPKGAAPGGHLDMSGNVWEWVQDPTESGSNRVDRGGSWGSGAQGCRSAIRGDGDPLIRYRFFGFRLSRSKDKDEGEKRQG